MDVFSDWTHGLIHMRALLLARNGFNWIKEFIISALNHVESIYSIYKSIDLADNLGILNPFRSDGVPDSSVIGLFLTNNRRRKKPSH